MFETVGDGQDTLAAMLQTGVQTLVMDIGYDEDAGGWQMCGRTSLSEGISTVSRQIERLFPTLYANLVVLVLRGGAAEAHYEALRDAIGRVGRWTYSAEKVKATSPHLNSLLDDQEKRVLVVALDDSLCEALGTVAFGPEDVAYVEGNDTIDCSEHTDSWSFIEREFHWTDVREYVRLGCSPVITGKSVANISELEALVKVAQVWSWGAGEPALTDANSEMQRCASLGYDSATERATWKSTSCRQNLPVLCQAVNDRYSWLVGTRNLRFDQLNMDSCPSGYKPSVPRTPLEQREVERYLSEHHPSDGQYWIYLNSISVEKCWVVGGPETPCPYVALVSTRNFAAMIVTSSILVLLLLVLIILLDLVRVPIQDNRRSWKRALGSYSKAETEGVPM